MEGKGKRGDGMEGKGKGISECYGPEAVQITLVIVHMGHKSH